MERRPKIGRSRRGLGLPVRSRDVRTLLFILLVLMGVACIASRTSSLRRDRPAHHTDRGFRNLRETRQRGGFGDFLRWRLGAGPAEDLPIPPEKIPPYRPNIVKPDLALIHGPDPRAIQVTWIGHSSFLVQVEGLNILIDPVFSERPSPVSFLGPKRHAAPGLPFKDLPPIDAVLISHDHFDHLDRPTIKRLGRRPRYIVPLGLRPLFGRLGMDKVSELDWGQTTFIGPVLFRCVPAQHFSGRGPFRFNRTLWAGWVIDAPAGKIFYAGDSGYSPHFREIGRRWGPFRVSFLPLGAYRPRWFMQRMHMDPAEAVQAHQDLGADLSIGMHWGTFKQSDEPMAEPPLYLKKVLKDRGLAEDVFIIMKFGQTLILDAR